MYKRQVLGSGRGIEQVLNLVAMNPNICAVVLGDGKESYYKKLLLLVEQQKIEGRVLFIPAVPNRELWKYISAVDLGMVLISNGAESRSYYLSLPNKLFENIQSMTPVICSNYPAMQSLVKQYCIGVSCDPENLAEINECVERMRNNKEFYEFCKRNLKIAKRELYWEKEKSILINALLKLGLS